VTLPVMPVLDDVVAADRRHPAAGGIGQASARDDGPLSVPDLSGARVLVVDDEPDARNLMRRLLEDCGAQVITAASVTEALGLVSSARPDVVVSDIGMPGEDGYELIRRLRALAPEAGGATPAVALTAYARSEDRTKAILLGFQHHVAKPVEPLELIAMVASLVRD
jgi:CheY-like chemotaxis protein